MNSLLRDLTAVCGVLLAAELLVRLCPENSAVRFVQALAVLVLLLSWVTPLFSLDWDLTFSSEQAETAAEDLTAYLEEYAAEAGKAELEDRLAGLLGKVGIKAEKIELFTDIGEDGGIVLTKAVCLFRYRTDAERAYALLRNVLGEQVEVVTDEF